MIAACLAGACALAAARAHQAAAGSRLPGVSTPANTSGLVLLADKCDEFFDTGEDCGAEGQTQAQCEDKGCCYDESNGKHWCWWPRAPEKGAGSSGSDSGDNSGDGSDNSQWECKADAADKDCGHQGIIREECEAKGCCYDETASFWCFPKAKVRGGDNHSQSSPEPAAKLYASTPGATKAPAPAAEGAKDEEKVCSKKASGKNCGQVGITQEECEASGCCYDETASNWCFEKTAPSAAPAKKGKEPSAGKDSTASDKGGSSGGGDSVSAAGAPLTLFCFSVMANGPEEKLAQVQEETGTGIFACDEWGKFTSNSSVGHEGEPALPTWTLTDTFIAAWKLLKTDGRYTNHSYVVKMDVDTVFFPDRLRSWLSKNEPPGNRVYLRSCAHSPNGLAGSLEVFSTGAVSKFLSDIDSCRESLDYSRWGEEVFTQKCMDRADVIAWNFEDLICDKVCDCDPSPCSFGKIAYHPFSDPDEYGQCIEESRR